MPGGRIAPAPLEFLLDKDLPFLDELVEQLRVLDVASPPVVIELEASEVVVPVGDGALARRKIESPVRRPGRVAGVGIVGPQEVVTAVVDGLTSPNPRVDVPTL